MRMLPRPLVNGDTIGVVAPAGNIHDGSKYRKGISILKDMGFQVKQAEKDWPGDSFLSDSDENRARELMTAWADPDTRAILALRGGYGSLRILERLDFDLIRANPKLFIGFSDITILLNTIVFNSSHICLHGPVLSSLAASDPITLERFYYCLTGGSHVPLKEQIEILRPAPAASGMLLGGNLSSLVTLIGTRWDIDYSGSILFLEDVNEPLYRLDRLLTQFFLSGKLSGVKGVILGDFSNTHATDPLEHDRTQEFVWNRILELIPELEVPVWGRFPAGHSQRNIALPLGLECTMDSNRGALSFKARRDGN